MIAIHFIKQLQKACLPLLLFLFFIHAANAKVVLPACFTDNMVLQQKTKVSLWGKATPNKTITIITSWNNKAYSAIADNAGNWKMKVITPVFGGPYNITFKDDETLTLNNILIGEVWLCSGQSNMEMTPTTWYGKVQNNEQEATNANYPEIRMLKIDNTTNMQPQTDVITKGGWTICSQQTYLTSSAVAYFFARDIYQDKHVPIGIINSSWGGTVAEAWTSGEALKQMPAYAPTVKMMEEGATQQQLEAKYKADMSAWLDNVSKKDPGFRQDKPVWAAPDLNASTWKTMNLPGFWEKAGLPDYDGTVWFRKKVNVPANWAGHDLSLKLGTVDDYDVSFFNGTQVGHTENLMSPRNYTIPGNLVKAGENTIAVRVLDNGGLGGFNSGSLLLSLLADPNDKIDLAGDWSYHIANKLTELQLMPGKPEGANRPTLIYNTMINPILPFTIRGVLWYQGESNVNKAYQYRELFPLMINDWRKRWGEGNIPFYFVQLSTYMARDKQPGDSEWAELREAQLKTLSLPNTGMAVAIDIGEDNGNIHPSNKQDVGHRLALIARAKTYGEKISYSGPIYKSQKIRGNAIELSFNYTDGGLKAKGDTLTGFAIAGADKKFYWAKTVIAGNKVVVSSPEVANPVAVRYAWGTNPYNNLYNGIGLPASPFRTDDWQAITYGKE